MTSKDSKVRFETLLAESDATTSQDIISCMLDFYRNERAEDCQFEHDGDMLLFQWGTHDWGKGRWFQFNITRQFIPAEEEDPELYQLSVTAKYTPSPKLDGFKSGNKWCGAPDELDDFQKFVQENPAMMDLSTSPPERLEIEYYCV